MEEGFKRETGYKKYVIQVCTASGIPIPASFILGHGDPGQISLYDLHWDDLKKGIQEIETKTKKEFGGLTNPLFLALRVDPIAPCTFFIPDIVNIGINMDIALFPGEVSYNRRPLLEIYLSFIKQFGSIVMQVHCDVFNRISDEYFDNENTFENIPDEKIIEFIKAMLSAIEKEKGCSFPQNPYDQLRMAMEYIANKEEYRGSEIIIQEMILGNLDSKSGSGVFNSRNPYGRKKLFGYYAPGVQIQDLFSSSKIPGYISPLNGNMDGIYDELARYSTILEKNFKYPLGVSFIVENSKIYIWDCFKAGLPDISYSNAIIDMVNDGNLTEEEGIMAINRDILRKLLSRYHTLSNRTDHVAGGIPISPGVIAGRVVFNAEDIAQYSNDPLILVKEKATPGDVMLKTSAIIIAHGSCTSHASIIAKNTGKGCIVGVFNLKIDKDKEILSLSETIVKKGEWITVDGSSGKIFNGKIDAPIIPNHSNVKIFTSWLNHFIDTQKAGLKVMVNCHDSKNASSALESGAEGIGLLRTENIFFSRDHITLVQAVLSDAEIDKEDQKLAEMGDILLKEITAILEIMNGLPVIIRLFDFRLDEVFPVANGNKTQNEFTSMLGLRGTRLLIKHKPILDMQVKSILRSAVDVKKAGRNVNIAILMPYVMNEEEILFIIDAIEKTAKKVFEEVKYKIDYKIGVMVEQPRTAFILDKITDKIDFISFGTNDLTQLTFGLNRDESEQVVQYYLEKGLLKNDPFIVLDEDGVGGLIKIALEKCKKNPHIRVGVCGEHAGNPENIEFFMNTIGKNFDHISCSLKDLLVTRFTVAQTEIRRFQKKQDLEKPLPAFNDNRNWHRFCLEQINESLKRKRFQQAREIALKWASAISKQYCIDNPVVWKFFKRDIATRWFGKTEHKNFSPGWNATGVMEYIERFPGNAFRVSIFPNDIACHAVSHYLPEEKRDSFMTILSGI
ncbi:MAG: PEP-utilizing enzyme, partial [Acidobacteria bacterium]|nr:PEP-utilizing enzyme [Acidobacteriota bacterium]